jgi:hypothetical protein
MVANLPPPLPLRPPPTLPPTPAPPPPPASACGYARGPQAAAARAAAGHLDGTAPAKVVEIGQRSKRWSKKRVKRDGLKRDAWTARQGKRRSRFLRRPGKGGPGFRSEEHFKVFVRVQGESRVRDPAGPDSGFRGPKRWPACGIARAAAVRPGCAQGPV